MNAFFVFLAVSVGLLLVGLGAGTCRPDDGKVVEEPAPAENTLMVTD